MRVTVLRPLLAAALLSPVLAFGATELTTLMPQPVHADTIKEVVKALTLGHYNKVLVDDALSTDLLDTYLEDLDPSRAFFFQSDIDEFESYRYTLDDQIRAGDVSAGFVIYNRLQERTVQQLNAAIARLKDPTPFDLNRDEYLDTDPSDNPWVQSQAEMDDLWRKRIKGAVLNLILADKTEAEARETLIKRYENQLKRLSQNKSEDVFQSFTNALTHHYDPHTAYFSPRGSENFRINMSLSLEGIGAVLQSENEFTKIVRLVPAGPADKTGHLKPADLIVGVGQGKEGEVEDVVGWRLDDVVDKIRGPKGSTVRLEVAPAGSKDKSMRKIVEIERNTVKLEEQAAQKRVIEIERGQRRYRIGVIDIPAFYIDFAALQRGESDYRSTTRDVEKLIEELKAKPLDGLMIDLRNNGGGSLREANELVGLFIDRGPTVQIRDQNGRVEIHGDFNPKISYSGPLAVIVNRLSASASEIFAGAIQDYQRGIVVGSQTFGKGTVQTLQPLNHGQLKLTHAKFYRISGESTQHKGVVPDINFPELFDKKEIGESALEGALPWDQVREARHGLYNPASSVLEELNRRHDQRTDNQPDFNFMREQIRRAQALREEKTLPLNLEQLKAKREQDEKWQIDTENARRIAKKQTPIATLDDLENLLKKDASGRPISDESEAVLEESANILIDVVELNQQFATRTQ